MQSLLQSSVTITPYTFQTTSLTIHSCFLLYILKTSLLLHLTSLFITLLSSLGFPLPNLIFFYHKYFLHLNFFYSAQSPPLLQYSEGILNTKSSASPPLFFIIHKYPQLHFIESDFRSLSFLPSFTSFSNIFLFFLKLPATLLSQFPVLFVLFSVFILLFLPYERANCSG